MAFTLEPLHANPELMDETIALLKEGWPHCLAERLKIVESSDCTGLPCSLILTESRESVVREVLGHVRITKVHPECGQQVYIESVTVKRARRREGLGRNLVEMTKDYARTCLKAHFIFLSASSEDNKTFFAHLGYNRCHAPFSEICANILRTCIEITWKGNIIPEEWKYMYQGEQPVLSEAQRYFSPLVLNLYS